MSKFQGKYPKGSISSIDELLNIVKEAKTENREIPLWAVEQMGSIRKLILTPDSKYTTSLERGWPEAGPQLNILTVVWLHKDGSYKDHICMGSYNLYSPQDNAGGVHRLFTNEIFAKDYSEELKNDPQYVAEVKAHWDWCEKNDPTRSYRRK